MRVTAETRLATRQRILDASQQLFAAQGFDAATTRDIARAAGIGVGTLFNYFSSKEAIVGCLAKDALAKADEEFHRNRDASESLNEALFAYAAVGLRKLRPLRKFLGAGMEAVFAAATPAGDNDGESIRSIHLETVGRLAAQHGHVDSLSVHAQQLYWALYTGAVAFWTQDRSPKQQDTLALLDESIEMFVLWLTR